MKVAVKTHPKSKSVKVLKIDQEHYEVWVTEAPDKGRANKAVVEALSDFLKLSKSSITVVAGLKSRNKVVSINYFANVC